eukprot:c43245_g1_i1 orf=189-1268(-)
MDCSSDGSQAYNLRSSHFLSGTQKLEDFVWPEDLRSSIPHDSFLEDDVFPEIDLEELAVPGEGAALKVVEKMSNAARTWGFFRVINHGVPQMLMERLICHAHRFFLLPSDRKMRVVKNSALPLGYRGSMQNVCMRGWLESFQVLWSKECIKDLAEKIWPCEENQRRDFCADIEHYTSLMGRLAQQLLELLLRGLNVDTFDVMKNFGPHTFSSLRFNYYPICPEPNLTFGSPQHCDYGAITILHQDEVGGLQILKDGEWVGVKPKRDSLIVNVGDITQVLTNCEYKSILHRTVVTGLRSRVSIAFLYNPCDEAVIAPLSKLVTPQCPAKYKAFTWNEYRSTFNKAQNGMHSPTVFFQNNV